MLKKEKVENIKSCNCPICGKKMLFSRTDMTNLGAVCSHEKFDVKIYLEEHLI